MELYNGMYSTCSARASERYFEVNNFGFHRGIDKDLVTRRPAGRPDYQLIFVKSGSIVYYADGKEGSVSEGEMLLFYPNEPQIYRYMAGENTMYDWFHFSGVGCRELLGDLFEHARVVPVGASFEFDEAMTDLRAHVNGEDALSKEYACGRIIMLLASLKQQSARRDRVMDKILLRLHHEKFGEGSNAQYAALADMSESHFLRRFTAYTGATPHKYKTRLLLKQAAELLRDTEMNVSEVSYAIGIDDSLYFSRIFKREYGVSPMKFKTTI